MGVQLAADNNIVELDNVNFSDTELVYHVRNALKSSIEGDRDSYNQLVGVMHHNERLLPEEVALLVTCLKSLNGAVSCIDIIHHQSLLASISRMSLWDYSSDVMDALVELITSLAGSSGQYVDFCLNVLVSNFMPPPSFIEVLKKPHGLRRKDQVLDHVHSTLKNIAELVPLSPLRLEKIISDRMPNIYTKEPLIVMYVENMLRLECGAIGEFIGNTMLLAIVDRLIDLDVEIAWEDILHDDFSKGIFEMELEELEGPADDPRSDGDELPRQAWLQRFFGGNKLVAEKLDSLMVLTLEHLKSSHEKGRLHQVFETLLQSFQKTVLTAYKSKFAQFVIFYACSLDPDYCGTRFADALINIFESSSFPERRMSAVAYLASYLSRAKFISTPLVIDMVERVANWCYSYSKNLNDDTNPKVHKLFYAGCQAMMYVLCFRMGAMLAVPRLWTRLRNMQIDDILRHKLNPLKVCLPSIVEEFLRLAKSIHLFAVPDELVPTGILESDFSRAFGGLERLDMFFPFDPCLLNKSDRFIRPNFVYWSMVRGTYENDDEDGAPSDEDVAEFSGRVNRMEIYDDESLGSVDDEASDHDLDEFDYSLNKMSITPKNPPTLPFESDLRGRYMQMPSKIRPSTSPESL